MQFAKGQTSIETLTIFAALLVFLIMLFTISQSQVSSVSLAIVQQKATKTVDILSATAKEVYAQGEGARKRVYVDMPEGYDYYNSSVSNRSISMRVLGSDFARTLDFDVYGTLPVTSGPQWVWVVNEGIGVRIGSSLIFVNKTTVITTIIQNQSITDNFAVQNVFIAPINVSINLTWDSSNVQLTVSPLNFSLNQNGANTVTLSYISNNASVGFYTGTLAITAVSGTSNQIVNLPITVEISIPSTGRTPPLFIVPNYWNVTLGSNQSIIKTFDICTNSLTTLSGVTFSTSGPAGSWISNIAPLPAINPISCLSKTFTLGVPANTSPANYTGTITGTGLGVSNAQDSVAVTVSVSSAPIDLQGPLVTNITKIPKKPFLGDPVIVIATCDDSTTGNNSIKKGEITLDGGVWNNMQASGGFYNSPIQNVSYSYYGIAFGKHNVTVRCTDSQNNVGPSKNYSFYIMKEILFVAHDNGNSGPEQNWVTWLSNHHSNEGFLWNNDVFQRSNIIAATFDINAYATTVLADSDTNGAPGASLVTILTTFKNNGGVIIVIDDGVQTSGKDLGAYTGSGSVSKTSITIRNNLHYITGAFSNGTLLIYGAANTINYGTGYSGTTLATETNATALTQPILGVINGFTIWGVTNPSLLNANGNTLSTSVFDFSIINSTMGAT